MRHEFTETIERILGEHLGEAAADIYQASPLLQYLNEKTRSASRGSKSRGAFANHYALYVLIEDYVTKGFNQKGDYTKYEGARFTDLMSRQRELPFGSKLQNHALNSRLNDEFHSIFPAVKLDPILRDRNTNRYWINQGLLRVELGKTAYDLGPAILVTIDAYVTAKQDAFHRFITDCERIGELGLENADQAKRFILGLINPEVDARVFEIVSYAILKEFYGEQKVFFGARLEDVREHALTLYKTGRTNANDGGIDFVMQPLGRFFQVTESLDVNKYFLDLDKVHRFPITFVIKSNESISSLRTQIEASARRLYPVDLVVRDYMGCIEELINVPVLMQYCDAIVARGGLGRVIEEIVRQSKTEFHYKPPQLPVRKVAEAKP